MMMMWMILLSITLPSKPNELNASLILLEMFYSKINFPPDLPLHHSILVIKQLNSECYNLDQNQVVLF